ncbi:SDR family NAD(P)-dependent oxidoreductase, partial [Streptomyces chilikensis]|uniref:SDR family NAD(P)-dependent oxidoreductase n=1 Tax=Streptomyces chilikensis TaxID=1194079 RepID=UPI001F0E805A
LDAALHAIGISGLPTGLDGPGLPFAFTGVQLTAVGSPVLRTRITTNNSGGGIALDLADATGAPLGRIDALTLRPVTPEQLDTPTHDSLFHLHWQHLTATPAETPAHTTVLEVPASHTDGDVPAVVQTVVADVLARLQEWLAAGEQDRRLVVVTNGAMAATGTEEVTNLAAAAVWGLVRSAQSEHPDRIVLVDTDGSTEDLTALAGLDEPQLAVREGEILVPRLARTTVPVEAALSVEAALPPVTGPVLVTGASGALGGLVARHLVTTHHVRDLVLVSRRPSTALAEELWDLGAVVRWAPCDVTDRDALAALIDELTASDGPGLSGVVHAAGVVDDGVLESLTPERLATVLRPKADAAWHLHQLTEQLDTPTHDSLFHLHWQHLTTTPSTAVDADVLDVPTTDIDSDVPATVQTVVADVLAQLQQWLASGEQDGRLLVTTRGAVSTGETDQVTDLAAAAVWGLVRSAQSEHPDRIVLVDTDGSMDNVAALAGLDEPQLAVRAGEVLVPRLVRTTVPVEAALPPVTGPVLITGAGGALGGLVARHLVTTHGVRDLVLVSRRPATALAEELQELGATVRWASCDVTDRDALAALISDLTA